MTEYKSEIAVINEQAAEIERLKDVLSRCSIGIKNCFHLIGHVQSAHPISKHCFNDLQWAKDRLREHVKYGEIEELLAAPPQKGE